MKLDIFISHRYDDEEIAYILRKHLLRWGISKSRIFLSSSVENPPQIGGTLQDDLRTALLEARMLFFLFTSSGRNWDRCIYEIGLATDPTTPTRTVVLKCTDNHLPSVFKDEVVVNMTKNDLRRFVTQFHKDKDFFPDQPGFNESLETEAMADRGERLFEELRLVIHREPEREIIRQGDSRWNEISSSAIDTPTKKSPTS